MNKRKNERKKTKEEEKITNFDYFGDIHRLCESLIHKISDYLIE
jgi:hypothetical protein